MHLSEYNIETCTKIPKGDIQTYSGIMINETLDLTQVQRGNFQGNQMDPVYSGNQWAIS